MKKNFLIVLGLAGFLFSSGKIIAQENKANINTSRSNIKNNRAALVGTNQDQCVISIVSNETGCDVVFTPDIKSPRDAATGLATGRRLHKPVTFAVNSVDNSVSEVLGPRDASTGQASGMRSAGNPIKGISVKGGKNPGGNEFNNLVVNDGKFSLPTDCPNGDCDLILSWSWGASNSGSSKTYCQCHFILSMENGACVAIKTKGTGASNR